MLLVAFRRVGLPKMIAGSYVVALQDLLALVPNDTGTTSSTALG